nr:unnamed protein product [Spirometra erinaceieuropaei]
MSELLESQYDETGVTIKRRHLVQLLRFCLKTYFTFEGATYEQVKGTPMGSPLSGFIAEAVLQKVETLVFAAYKSKFWTRYVDDTLVIIKRQKVQEFHDVRNSVFPDIQFTMEAEANNQLSFLDFLVHRKPNGHLKKTHVKILGRRSDRIAREIIEAWHTGTTSINRCVALPAPYQALQTQLSKQMSRRESRLNMNPDMSESMADPHSVTPQPDSDEGAFVTTAVPSTSPANEKTGGRCGVNKIASLGRQLRSMKVRTTTTNVSTPAPDVD